MAPLWSDDGTSYLVCGPTPVSDGSAAEEKLLGPYRPHHLFAVDVKSGAARRVMDETPEELLAFDDRAQRIAVRMRNGDLVILRRTADADGAWREEQRTSIPAAGLSNLVAIPGDVPRFAGIHQTPIEPPDLELLEIPSGYHVALTEIQPGAARTNARPRGKDRVGGKQ